MNSQGKSVFRVFIRCRNSSEVQAWLDAKGVIENGNVSLYDAFQAVMQDVLVVIASLSGRPECCVFELTDDEILKKSEYLCMTVTFKPIILEKKYEGAPWFNTTEVCPYSIDNEEWLEKHIGKPLAGRTITITPGHS